MKKTYQGSKKKGRQSLNATRLNLNGRLQVMEAIVGKLLERENLSLVFLKEGGFELIDRAVIATAQEQKAKASDITGYREIPEDEPNVEAPAEENAPAAS